MKNKPNPKTRRIRIRKRIKAQLPVAGTPSALVSII